MQCSFVNWSASFLCISRVFLTTTRKLTCLKTFPGLERKRHSILPTFKDKAPGLANTIVFITSWESLWAQELLESDSFVAPATPSQVHLVLRVEISTILFLHILVCFRRNRHRFSVESGEQKDFRKSNSFWPITTRSCACFRFGIERPRFGGINQV